MAAQKFRQRIYNTLVILWKMFLGSLLSIIFIMIVNVTILLATGLLNGDGCKIKRVEQDYSLLRSNLFTLKPQCYECHSDSMYLDVDEYHCLHKCP